MKIKNKKELGMSVFVTKKRSGIWTLNRHFLIKCISYPNTPPPLPTTVIPFHIAKHNIPQLQPHSASTLELKYTLPPTFPGLWSLHSSTFPSLLLSQVTYFPYSLHYLAPTFLIPSVPFPSIHPNH